MSKRTLNVLLVAVVAACLVSRAAAQNVVKKGKNLAEVTVTGMGMDKDVAIADAMRKAVAQAAGTFIYSQSKVRDFALIRDTILTRSAGFVQSHKVLSETKTADGVWEVKVLAVVSIKGIEDTWGVVRNLLALRGRPKIMVFISEKIDGSVQDDSTVQTRIEKLLLESGFLLVNRDQIQAIRKKDLESAVAENNPAKLQAIAKQFGAQLFISGSTNAAAGRTSQTYGVTMYRSTADGDIKCYRSDTAQQMSSRNEQAYMADKDSPRKAAKRAIELLGDKLAPMVQGDILRFWEDALEGRGEIVLEIESLEFKQFVEIKKTLTEMKELSYSSGTFSNKVGTFRFESNLRAEQFAEKLVGIIDKLDITDISANVIKGKLKT